MRTKFFALFASLVTAAVMANNITVSNTTVSGQNVTNHTLNINFDVSWENSWRTITNESNYDAAWVFIKCRVNGTQEWRHCTIRLTGNTPATGAVITVPADQKGVFLNRSATNIGIGNVSFTGNILVWNYGADGVADNATVEVKVFALEMVYIPTGAYWLGSGGSEANCFQKGDASGNYKVTSNAAIPVNTTTGLSFNGLGSGTSIPSTFPNAYDAYWIMKYECSQQQYADFLNTLDLAQATVLNIAPANFVVGSTHPNFLPVAADRAFGCYNKSFSALTSLADWSGLRPMSELEFEKACRGVNVPAVPNEFPWGSTTISYLTGVNNAGLPNETIGDLPSPQDANAQVGLYGNAVRVGLFARTSGSTRQNSGATYYGVMNMADNVFEVTVFAGSPEGMAIDRNVHGNGYLNPSGSGFTDILAWREPAFSRRGTSYQSNANYLGSTNYARTSNRGLTLTGAPVMDGIRLVRTAQ